MEERVYKDFGTSIVYSPITATSLITNTLFGIQFSLYYYGLSSVPYTYGYCHSCYYKVFGGIYEIIFYMKRM